MAENKAPADFRGRFAVGDFAGVLWLEATDRCRTPAKAGVQSGMSQRPLLGALDPGFRRGTTIRRTSTPHPKTAIRHKKLSSWPGCASFRFSCFNMWINPVIARPVDVRRSLVPQVRPKRQTGGRTRLTFPDL
ncbi:hypothetical protein [Sphingopyxis sp. FD7]|jgi:hypothetical protein|uniref:hypothetical protein n=1 Tax=Sphingopyxis sp. FD7 TaxID=1914525 RepID=UPI0011BA9676|nr:hypothetical protein [Sphingopyxis sp. FD7]